MKRSTKRRKQGISEIIASLLMIVVVVGLSATVFAFATNGFSNLGNNLSNLFGNSANALSERIVVEQVTFNETGAKLGANLYVRNDGLNPVTISAVYVSNITASKFVLSYTVSPAKQINSGSFAIIAVTFTPDVGSTYALTVASQLGNTVVTNAKA
jgi:flagellin-like protein